jgi:hypothetical protein
VGEAPGDRPAWAFADWGISDPSFVSVVRTEDHGVLELSLVLSHA